MRKKLLSVVFVLTTLAACSENNVASEATGSSSSTPPTTPEVTQNIETLNVQVWYRERILLPHTNQLTVTLEDVSKMDVAATVLAETSVSTQNGPPYQVSLSYDAAEIKSNRRYVVRAKITEQGQLRMTSTQSTPAFEQENGVTKVMVSSVATSQITTSSGEEAEKPESTLENTYWRLVEVNGKEVLTKEGMKEAHMILQSQESRVKGYGGCNSFSGNYQLVQGQLTFLPMMATQRACAETMDNEMAFLKGMAQMQRYKIAGEQMSFFDEQDNLLMQFKAVYLK